jgi:hypothetical protein
MSTFHLAKKDNAFIPADTESQIKAYKVKQGEVVRCKKIDRRNYEFHKKFFALISFTFHNLPVQYDGNFVDEDDLREELLKAVGWKRTYTNFKGVQETRAKSVSYDSVGQEKFEKIYNRVLDVVCRMVGVEETDIMDELLNFM